MPRPSRSCTMNRCRSCEICPICSIHSIQGNGLPALLYHRGNAKRAQRIRNRCPAEKPHLTKRRARRALLPARPCLFVRPEEKICPFTALPVLQRIIHNRKPSPSCVPSLRCRAQQKQKGRAGKSARPFPVSFSRRNAVVSTFLINRCPEPS